MTKSASLLMISGSLRTESFNRKLLQEAVRCTSCEATVADIDLPLYNGDVENAQGVPEKAVTLHQQIESADAVVISTPEYNQAMSGVLKNALDWVSRVEGNPWMDKPVAIMSAAAGRTGGARAQYSLRLAMNSFQPCLLTGPELMVSSAHGEFDEAGKLTNERYLMTLQKLMDKLIHSIE